MRRIACVFVGLASLISGATAAQVDVELHWRDAAALEVVYRLPAECRSVGFRKSGTDAAAIRASWQPLDDCGSADGESLHAKHQGCAAMRFRVPVRSDKIAGYPAAAPMAGAIYAHTSNYSLRDDCGPLRFRFAAPAVALEGRVALQAATPQQSDGSDIALLLLPKPLATTDGSLAYLDPQLGQRNLRRIQQVADGTIGFLRQAMPNAPFRMPILAAARVEAPGGPRFEGDAGDVLRLTLFNWPKRPDPALQAQLDLLVSHEFAHRFQLRDAVDIYPDARLIHEGGGEFLRWITGIRQGWLSHTEAAEQLDTALGECMLAVGDAAWRSLSPERIARAMLAYRCGLPVYAYGLAQNAGTRHAFQRLQAFYQALQSGKTPDFAQAIECAGDEACKPRWLPRILGDESMTAAWQALVSDVTYARLAPPNTSQTNAMLLQAVERLVSSDCGGRSSLFVQPDHVILDELPGCQQLKPGMVLRRVEQQPLFGPGALTALVEACEQRQRVLFTDEHGQRVELACAQPYRPRQTFVAVDIDALLAALGV
ncbi:MAG TPA: hypothetical protein VEA16_03360 [Vicinamibacterales bacterium]|nr:hypothetical protein [Vicinamibacterales bacterium]